MGGGHYSYTNAVTSSVKRGFATNTVASSSGADMSRYRRKAAHEVFTSRHLDSEMSPYDVKLRESRDSDEHPESLVDVTSAYQQETN